MGCGVDFMELGSEMAQLSLHQRPGMSGLGRFALRWEMLLI